MSIIETAARAQMLAEYPGDPNRWENAPEHSRWLYRARTRTVLLAVAEALYAPVLALHYQADNDANRTPICPDCKGRAGVHPCGCWADTDRRPVCGHCNGERRFESIIYPCPTVSTIRDTLAAIKDGAA